MIWSRCSRCGQSRTRMSQITLDVVRFLDEDSATLSRGRAGEPVQARRALRDVPSRTIQPALGAGRAPRKPGCGDAANPAFNCRTSTSQHCWRWSCRMLTACQPAASATGTTPTVRPDTSCMASTPRVVPADQLGSRGRLASQHARRHGPSSPDAGEDRAPGLGPYWSPRRAGWAKGARSWPTPSGSRTPPRWTAPATGWSPTSRGRQPRGGAMA
jgi:hypothetical protein